MIRLAAIAIVLSFVVSCAQPGQYQGQPLSAPGVAAQLADDAQAMIDDYAAQIAELQAQVATMGDEQERAESEQILEDLRQLKAEAEEALAFFRSTLDAEGNLDPGAVVNATAPLLPLPWNIAVGVGGGLLVEWLRNGRFRRGARQVIESIDAAKQNTDFATAWNGASDAIAARMGTAGKNLVARVRAKKPLI